MKKGFTLPEVLVSLIIFSLIIATLGNFQNEFLRWEKQYFLENLVFQQQRIGLQYLERRLKNAEALVEAGNHALRVSFVPFRLQKKGYRYQFISEKNRQERYYLSRFKQGFYSAYPAPKMGLTVEKKSRSPIVYYFGAEKEDLQFLYFDKNRLPLLSREERQKKTHYIKIKIQTPLENGHWVRNELLVSLPRLQEG